MAQQLPPEFLELLQQVTARRPKTVIDHILQHGYVTTQELRDLYGYNHPPRGARDVREQGIPLETFRVTGPDGRSIGAYRFGDPAAHRGVQLVGRSAFSSNLKTRLIEEFGPRCNIYLQEFPERELQIDHRIPFEISGDHNPSDTLDEYMLLCRSANRAKSWSCEHCDNWKARQPEVCSLCYWAFPENYSHVAMHDMRRLDIIWLGGEIAEYDLLNRTAANVGENIPEFVKEVIRRHLDTQGEGIS